MTIYDESSTLKSIYDHGQMHRAFLGFFLKTFGELIPSYKYYETSKNRQR